MHSFIKQIFNELPLFVRYCSRSWGYSHEVKNALALSKLLFSFAHNAHLCVCMCVCVYVSVRESEKEAIYIHIKKTHMQIDTRHPCTQY